MTLTTKDTKLDELPSVLQYSFLEPDLLRQALTHPSAVAEREPRTKLTYDRLEFLGDRVLAIVVAHLLYERFPDAPSGDLARRFNELVRRETLAEVALSINLGDYIIMGEADAATGGASNPAILADVLEAILAGIYLDGGLAVAEEFIQRHWAHRAAALLTPPADAKTALQEWAQALAKPPPTYRVIRTEGPPHKPMFLIAVDVDGEVATCGKGSTKRQAEQQAAETMLTAIAGAGVSK